MVFHAVFLDAAVLDIQDLAKTHAMFVFAHGAGHHPEAQLLGHIPQFLLGQDDFLFGDLEGGLVDIEGDLALHLHEAAFGGGA